jgi:hypothetical protein
MTSLLVGTLMIVAACGGNGSTDTTNSPQSTAENPGSPDPESTSTLASSGDLDPCGFVSDPEMSQILEMGVAGETAGSVITCDYLPTDSEDLLAGGVNMVVEDVSDGGCEPVFNVAGYGSTGGEPVDGVGTYAKYGADFVPQLAVCFDDEITLIASLGMESEDPKATLVAIAQAFEANIP